MRDPDSGETWSCCDQPGYMSIRDGLAILAEADVIIGHNILKFDLPALALVYPSWSPKQGVVIRDTLTLCCLIWPDTYEKDSKLADRGKLEKHLIKRQSLKAWGQRLGVMKDDYSGGWDLWSKEMQDYAEQDAEVTTALWNLIESKNYSDEAIELEHDFQQIIIEQTANGFPFDFDKAVKLQGRLAERRLELEEELVETFGSWWVRTSPLQYGSSMNRKRADLGEVTIRRFSEKTGKELKPYVGPVIETIEKGLEYCPLRRVTFNPGSRDHIAKVLMERFGWKPPAHTANGKPKVDEDTLSGLDNIPEAALIIEYLMIKKREGQLGEGQNAWLRLAKRDDDGVWRLHGDVNTNGAVTGRCTHSRPNVTQVPSIKNAKGVVPFGKDCRELFIPGPGFVQVGADASGLELRCLAHYLGAFDGGNYTDLLLNGDPHVAMQEAAGLPSRDTGKRFGYAYLYGAGDVKLGSIIDPAASTAKQRKLGKAARASAESKLPGLGTLIKRVKTRARSGELRGLDGRLIPVRSAHSALNTLLQSAGAIVMKKATVVLHEIAGSNGWEHGTDFRQMAHVHDEIQSAVLEGIADEFGQAVVDAIIHSGDHFNFRCPLDGEYKIGRSWADCH